MQQIELATGDGPVDAYLAHTFADRFFGTTRLPSGSVLVLRARSVHSFGMRDPIEIVGLDAGMKVVAIRTLRPNRIALIASARLIMELPGGSSLPAVDDLVSINHG